MDRTSTHYDDAYFAWEAPMGEFGAWADLPRFAPFIRRTDKVIDFGCGGGYMLPKLRCVETIGIEPSEAARAEGAKLGVRIVATPAEIPDDWADVIVSNNALEHCRHPLTELEELRTKLKPGGRIVFMVPCESIHLKYVPNLPGHHLYCWSPMALGNLFTEAGFQVEESTAYYHKWPWRLPYRRIAKIGGRRLFDLACRINGHIDRSWIQVRIVARRPLS